MASLEVLHTQNDSGSFSPDDYSLLAEVETPIGSAQNGDLNHQNNDNFNFTNMQSALTASSDSSLEIHSQINELIEENNRLKEMMKKNNLAMQENLKKAEEKISSLENENSKLCKDIVDLKRNEKQQGKSCLKCTTLETGLNNMLGMDYIEENQHLLCEWSYFRENLYENLKYVCHNLEDISKSKKKWEEQILLDAYVLMLKFKIAFLEGNAEGCQFASLRTDEETGFEIVRLKAREIPPQLLIEELKKVVKDKDEELTSLKKEGEHFVEKIKAYELKIQECDNVLKSQCELLNKKSQIESSLPQQYRERCKILEEQIKEFQTKFKQKNARTSDDQVIQKLQEEIQNLKEILKIEQQTNKNDKEKLSVIMTKCEKLQVDYDRVTKLLEIQSKDEKKKIQELTLRENDVKRYMEEADHLTAKLIEVQEQLDERSAEIRELKDHLAQDVKKEPFSSRNQGKSSDQRNQRSEAGEVILCPICAKGFTNERAAENHIDRCLEETK